MPETTPYNQELFDATVHLRLFAMRIADLSKVTTREYREGAFGVYYRNAAEGLIMSTVIKGPPGISPREPGRTVNITQLLNDGTTARKGLAMVIHSHTQRDDRDYRRNALPSAQDLQTYRKHCEAGRGHLIHGVFSVHPRFGGAILICYRENSRRKINAGQLIRNSDQTDAECLNAMQRANLNVIRLRFNPRNGLLQEGKKEIPRLFA